MSVTAMVVFTAFIVLGIYDAITVYRSPDISSSISRFLQRLGFRSPMFVFVFGVVIGHIFFYMEPECECPVTPKTTQGETP